MFVFPDVSSSPVQHARDNDIWGDQGWNLNSRPRADQSSPTLGHWQGQSANPDQEPKDERDGTFSHIPSERRLYIPVAQDQGAAGQCQTGWNWAWEKWDQTGEIIYIFYLNCFVFSVLNSPSWWHNQPFIYHVSMYRRHSVIRHVRYQGDLSNGQKVW